MKYCEDNEELFDKNNDLRNRTFAEISQTIGRMGLKK